MRKQYARFKVGDAVLYKNQRYMIVSPVWVDPFPGYFSWNIERLMDHADHYEQPRIYTLEWIAENGIVYTREDGRYRTFIVSEDELEGVDDPPTWKLVDGLRAQIATLDEALKAMYRQRNRRHKTGW